MGKQEDTKEHVKTCFLHQKLPPCNSSYAYYIGDCSYLLTCLHVNLIYREIKNIRRIYTSVYIC